MQVKIFSCQRVVSDCSFVAIFPSETDTQDNRRLTNVFLSRADGGRLNTKISITGYKLTYKIINI